jgi:hypothetical protein
VLAGETPSLSFVGAERRQLLHQGIADIDAQRNGKVGQDERIIGPGVRLAEDNIEIPDQKGVNRQDAAECLQGRPVQVESRFGRRRRAAGWRDR